MSCLIRLFSEERRTYICLSPLFMEEEGLIFVHHFVGQQTSIVCSCGVLAHFTIQVFFKTFYNHNVETEKTVAMATLAA